MVAGGAALGRLDDGRRILVTGALPGERVEARTTRTQPGLVHAVVTEVTEAAPERVAPPCPLVAAGCGGCDWQHIDTVAQGEFKRDIVVDALRRIGRLDEPPVAATISLTPVDYRTTIRALVTADGEIALRKARSHDAIAITGCMVADPGLRALIDTVRFSPYQPVTLRAGAGTSERLAVGAGPRPASLPSDVAWSDNSKHAKTKRDASTTGSFTARVGAARFEVPPTAFFQPHVDGPARLSELVAEMLPELSSRAERRVGEQRLADLYAGVGLFATTLPAASVVAVERHRPSAEAARRNLLANGHSEPRSRVIVGDVDDADIGEVDAVVADPSRAGLGRAGAAAVARTGAEVAVLVSCDAASLGRDTMLLAELGYHLERAVPVDQFGHTSHIEIVSRFTRA